MGKHTSTTVVHIYNYGYDGSPQTWTRTDGGVGDCRAGYGSFDPSAASSLTYSKDDEYYVDPTDDTSTDCFVRSCRRRRERPRAHSHPAVLIG